MKKSILNSKSLAVSAASGDVRSESQGQIVRPPDLGPGGKDDSAWRKNSDLVVARSPNNA